MGVTLYVVGYLYLVAPLAFPQELPRLLSGLKKKKKVHLQMLEMQQTLVRPLRGEDPLEDELATHCSILAGKIPQMEEPGGLQSMRSQSRTGLST